MTMKSLTIRLPEDVYNESRRIAHNRQESMNILVRQALEAVAREEKEKELFDAFGLIGDDPDTDISFAEAIQWEAIKNE